MAVTSTRFISITFTEGVTGTEKVVAAANQVSPGSITLHALTAGANTIIVPVAATVATCATIIPPDGNTLSITFKGVSGDTGVRLHNTDPSAITLHSSVGSFCLFAGGTITGLRIIWS